MNGKILVVGGYGSVGRVICTALGNRFPGLVIAAGRNIEKAEKFSVETRGRVLPLELDIRSPQSIGRLDSDVKLVIMCIDQLSTDFVENCLQRGIHYIDITASYELLSKIESLNDKARQYGATAILSVGLAPGLTNLLVAHLKSLFDEIRHADIFIMLGLGEAHGEAAIRWTVENLNSGFHIHDTGMRRHVRCFGEGRKTTFPESIGRRTAFRFNFSDQLILPRTLGVDSVATWLCFDSALTTWALALAGKAGLFKILRFRFAREFLVGLFKTVHFGSDKFAIKVEARGVTGHRYSCNEATIAGSGEGYATGLVVAKVAEHLCTSYCPPGVFHIEQLFEPLDFIAKLKSDGLKFTIEA